MKGFKSLLIALCFLTLSYAQTDCRPYVPTEKGATWELSNYDAKGKLQGTVQYEVIEKEISGNDITFTIKTVAYDNKGKEVYSNSFDAKCLDGKFDFDMAFKMDTSTLQAYENMDVEVDASKFEIPSLDAAAGTMLEDGSLVVGVGSGGASLFKMTIDVTNRKVESRESLTTPAGTFDCIVLTQQISTKMMIRVQGSSKEWYAENIGLVRSESYNKKGKLMGYSELTKLNL